MTRKEKRLIISEIKNAKEIKENYKRKWIQNKTKENKEAYIRWSNIFLGREILANGLGINIHNGIEDIITEEEMKMLKRI